MNRYRIRYTDDCDPCCPVFTTARKGYNEEHARERFDSEPDSDGWKIVSVERVKEE